MTLRATIVIPVRNEQADIEGCLRAVAAQDVGPDALDVIVADGRSTDRTRAVVEAVGSELGFESLRCVDNPAGGIGAGLNRALDAATTDHVVRVDARSRIEPHYVRTVCELLDTHPDVGVCGGAQVPLDRGTGPVSAGIARALSNRFTTGLSRYRRSTASGPADTVWMGAFRTAELRELGGWDEALVVNEDYELCERYRAAGRRVWFDATLRSGYLPRADLRALALQYHTFGRTKGRRWSSGAGVSARHLALLAGPPAAGLVLGAVAARRGWPSAVALCGVGLLVADHLGSSGEASASERLAAVAATVVSDTAWLAGVLRGYVEAGGS